jgi:phospholipid-binding lipoprotein MlaA
MIAKTLRPGFVSAVSLSLVLALSGCASTGQSNPKDPFEGMNRAIYSFNTAADKAFTKPIAQAYKAVVPELFRGMASNAFSNVNDLWVGVNNLLQGKPVAALSDWTRFLINSTVGFAGIADVASEIGLRRNNEDFGQTLGRWGVPPGPFIMLPLLGPSNLRDGISIVPDTLGDPIRKLPQSGDRDKIRIIRLIDTRANLLGLEKIVDGAALDPYGLLRDGFMARRRSLVYDGDPPEEKEAPDNASDEADKAGANKPATEKKEGSSSK